MHLHVVTLNAWNDEGNPGRARLMNRALHRLDPDLVALQNVVQTGERSQLDDLLAGMDLHRTHQLGAMPVSPPWVDRYGGTGRAATTLVSSSTSRTMDYGQAISSGAWSILTSARRRQFAAAARPEGTVRKPGRAQDWNHVDFQATDARLNRAHGVKYAVSLTRITALQTSVTVYFRGVSESVLRRRDRFACHFQD